MLGAVVSSVPPTSLKADHPWPKRSPFSGLSDPVVRRIPEIVNWPISRISEPMASTTYLNASPAGVSGPSPEARRRDWVKNSPTSRMPFSPAASAMRPMRSPKPFTIPQPRRREFTRCFAKIPAIPEPGQPREPLHRMRAYQRFGTPPHTGFSPGEGCLDYSRSPCSYVGCSVLTAFRRLSLSCQRTAADHQVRIPRRTVVVRARYRATGCPRGGSVPAGNPHRIEAEPYPGRMDFAGGLRRRLASRIRWL